MIAWLGYISSSQRQAVRERARLHAFYAAEAGIEQIVDFFNNPANFEGKTPSEYTQEFATHPDETYPLDHNVAPDYYDLFQPYIVLFLWTSEKGLLTYWGEGNWRRGRDSNPRYGVTRMPV